MDLAKRYIEKFGATIERAESVKALGKITDIVGSMIASDGPNAAIGEICSIVDADGDEVSKAEVVGYREGRTLSIAFGDSTRISPKCMIVGGGRRFSIPVGDALLGRTLDGLGNPIDGKGEIKPDSYVDVHAEPPNPMTRRRITEPLQTGVRAVDGLLTCGRGQRVGIFSGSGVGKSTMLGMIARNTSADVSVIALVGERGREVREFIEKDLGEDGLKRSVLVVATSDKPALMRVKSAFIATAIAEYFRERGKDVALMMDSVTRFAMAQREIGLSTGEPPTTKGYTPSVFALLPKLLERAGASERGAITGFYTVLVDADDMTEPIADAARSILDGHFVLSRKLANKGQFPAVDPLQSVSRLMSDVVDSETRRRASKFVDYLAAYEDAEDLINIGAYVKGSNARIDEAVAKIEQLRAFLRQDVREPAPFDDTRTRLFSIVD
ncbi:MAG: FliI/YscN family ATPase [Ignavibacteriales bacterium]|nr:FliI/YscN family ATPase [Ignavibacteriales bacterium]